MKNVPIVKNLKDYIRSIAFSTDFKKEITDNKNKA